MKITSLSLSVVGSLHLFGLFGLSGLLSLLSLWGFESGVRVIMSLGPRRLFLKIFTI